MIERISTYVIYGKVYCGIEHINYYGKDTIFVSTLKKSKKEISLIERLQFGTISEVAEKLSKKQHAFIIINNAQVLSKTIESPQTEKLKLFYTAYPNINPEDFYFEIITEGSKHFISACRIDYVQSMIDEYLENKIFVIGFSLGNHMISVVKPFLNANVVFTSNAKVGIKDGLINNIEILAEVEPNTYDVNGEYVSNEHLLSYSGALSYILNNIESDSNFENKTSNLNTGFKQVQFFDQFLKFAGIFILALLLINFFFFNHYFNEVNELSQVSQINQNNKSKILKLDEEVSKKQKLVDDLLKSGSSKSSYYLNLITNILPESIVLSEFNYQPLIKRVKEEKPIEIHYNQIILVGSSGESKELSDWIEQLESLEWVSTVEIQDYGYENRRSSDFQIKIKLKNE